MLKISSLIINNKEVLPIVEGGKGISISTGVTAGNWAKNGGIGTFSGVNAVYYDENGNIVKYTYKSKNRTERHNELIQHSIKGGISQAKIARDIAGKNGCININILWEMGGAQEILKNILSNSKGLINGITCGAGMPYKLAQIAAEFNVLYYPIISSARAFNALYRRSFHQHVDLLGGVVYEDPWKAGGHNGLSNAESPLEPQSPYLRLVELRKLMNEFNLQEVPIILAGNVWWISEFTDYIDNPEIGKIAFQFGTRPIITQENPICDKVYSKFMSLKKGDILLTKLSPTGFYSSAVNNKFLHSLLELNQRQIKIFADCEERRNENNTTTGLNVQQPENINIENPIVSYKNYNILKSDITKFDKFIADGFEKILITPDSTIIFVNHSEFTRIINDQRDCVGCLSGCRFSNWGENGPILPRPDPRSFCIQKTLQSFANDANCVDDCLFFSGHNGYRFALDPFYADGFIPTTKELITRIMSGF